MYYIEGGPLDLLRVVRLIKYHQQKSAPKDGYRQFRFIIVLATQHYTQI
jgi:hypothetical protein